MTNLESYVARTIISLRRTIEAKRAANAAPISAERPTSVDAWVCTSGPRSASDDAPSTLRSPTFAREVA